MTILSTVKPWWSLIGRIGDTDVFHVDLSPNSAKEHEAFQWLDNRERSRRDRLLSPGPRRRFTLCRAALRALLCSKLECQNHVLGFGAAYYGKPFAIVRGNPQSISFNVSHSNSHGLIAFSLGGRLGVDVEDLVPRRNLEMLVESAFTSAERSDLNSAIGTEKWRLFSRLWTIKEALIKATGMGLSLDMSTFEVPPAIRRGAANAVFTFPQAPSVLWRVETICNKDYCAAIAHEILAYKSFLPPVGTNPSREGLMS